MSSTPQVVTQEISDTDLDNVSGGVFAGVAGSVSVDSVVPVSVSVEGGAGISLPNVTGIVAL